jgi:hypothetical protein
MLPCFIGGCITPASIVLKTPVGRTQYKPLCKEHYNEIVNSVKQLKRAEESGHGTEVTAAFIKASDTSTTISVEEYHNMMSGK